MAQKPSVPKGTRDFSPAEMVRRDFIFNTIKDVFRLHGYQPVETPAMENLSTLLGKYGEEGDKLLFRILNSGDILSELNEGTLTSRDNQKLVSMISEKGLRYDLTVPFARYVVQHQNEIIFPFKRYQIQPVWRADRPQKGRYREFFQCDADVIGSSSLYNEYELIIIIDEVFSKLAIPVTVKINNRKILAGLAEIAGVADRLTDITVAIDKIEKAGMDAAVSELLQKGVSQLSINKLKPVLEMSGDTALKLEKLSKVLMNSASGLRGVEEARSLFSLLEFTKTGCTVELDLTLARGLNYYTGAIIEVKANNIDIGSICGGGRYDNLTGIFGLEGVSGVGVSFGADRIYDVMTTMNLFRENLDRPVKALVVNFGSDTEAYNIRLTGRLNREGISAMYYPDEAKLKKQLAYADSNRIPFVILAGVDEVKTNSVTVKNMSKGSQESISEDRLPAYLRDSIL